MQAFVLFTDRTRTPGLEAMGWHCQHSGKATESSGKDPVEKSLVKIRARETRARGELKCEMVATKTLALAGVLNLYRVSRQTPSDIKLRQVKGRVAPEQNKTGSN